MEKETKQSNNGEEIQTKGKDLNKILNEKSVMELIEELCPDGVEYKKLYEVTIWNKKFNSVENFKQPSITKYPTLFAVDLFKLQQKKGNIFLLSTGERTGWTTEEKAGKNLCEGEVVAIPGGKSRPLKEVLKYYKGKFVTGDNRIATSIDEKILLTKYLYYFIQSNAEDIDKMYRGATIQHPDMEAVLDMEIPIPPLKVQEEIVKVLDTMESLTATLTAELDLRKKQYEYYRDDLLSFPDGGAKIYTLEEICEITAGGDIKKENVRKTKDETYKYPVYSNGIEENALYGYTNTYKKENCITVSGRGTIGWVAYRQEKFYPIVRLICLKANEKIIEPKFLKYCLQNMEFESTYGGIPQLTVPMIKKYEVLVPALEKQKQIVEILEPFEKLTQSYTEGIPAEIEGRKKQYEYYRDLLLSFKRKED